MRHWKGKWIVTFVCCILLLCACANTTAQRTADQWLKLSSSSLAGKDDYRFSGSILQGFENGVSLTPHAFEGEVQQHKHITMHTETSNMSIRNPALEMDFVVKNMDAVTIQKYLIDEATMRNQVQLQVIANEEAATERWKERIREEYTSMTMGVLSNVADHKEKEKLLLAEIDKGRETLEAMLKTLKVTADYDVFVDTKTLLPMKIDGHIKLQYVRDDVPYSEYRTTNIRFDMFPNAVNVK